MLDKSVETKRKVLFACAENSGRSQMAEAIFNKMSIEKDLDWVAESAGAIPKDEVNPLVKKLLDEKGFETKNLKPKELDFDSIDKYNKVISFGCIVKATLPEGVLEKFLEWRIDDPSLYEDEIERIYIEIYENIKILIRKLEKKNI